MHDLSNSLAGKRLYLSHVAAYLESIETGRRPMNPMAYRLFARRMKDGLAGYPAALLAAHLGDAHPAIQQALEQRHFEAHGAFAGRRAERARVVANALLRRLTRYGR